MGKRLIKECKGAIVINVRVRDVELRYHLVNRFGKLGERIMVSIRIVEPARLRLLRDTVEECATKVRMRKHKCSRDRSMISSANVDQ